MKRKGQDGRGQWREAGSAGEVATSKGIAQPHRPLRRPRRNERVALPLLLQQRSSYSSVFCARRHANDVAMWGRARARWSCPTIVTWCETRRDELRLITNGGESIARTRRKEVGEGDTRAEAGLRERKRKKERKREKLRKAHVTRWRGAKLSDSTSSVHYYCRQLLVVAVTGYHDGDSGGGGGSWWKWCGGDRRRRRGRRRITLRPCERRRDGRKVVTSEVTRPGEKVGVAWATATTKRSPESCGTLPEVLGVLYRKQERERRMKGCSLVITRLPRVDVSPSLASFSSFVSKPHRVSSFILSTLHIHQYTQSLLRGRIMSNT